MLCLLKDSVILWSVFQWLTQFLAKPAHDYIQTEMSQHLLDGFPQKVKQSCSDFMYFNNIGDPLFS